MYPTIPHMRTRIPAAAPAARPPGAGGAQVARQPRGLASCQAHMSRTIASTSRRARHPTSAPIASTAARHRVRPRGAP